MFTAKQPNTPQLADQSQVSGYKDPNPIPIAYGFDRYGSQWLCDRFNITHVSAGSNLPDHIYCSIAALYCCGPIDYVGDVWKNDARIASLNYTFSPGEESHTFTILANMKGGFNWTVTVHRGTETDTASSTLIAGTGQSHPPYRGICWAEWTNLGQDDGADALPDMALEIGRKAPTVGTFTSGFDRSKGVNPIAALYGLFTERKGGVGADTSLFDATHWATQAAALESDGVGQRTGTLTYCHPQLTQAQDAAQPLSDLLTYIDGFLYFVGGQVRVGWFPNRSVDATGLTEIAEGDLEEKPAGDGFLDWNNAATSTAIVYKSSGKEYIDDAVVYQAPANSETGSGVSLPQRKDRPFIHDDAIAALIAAELASDVNGTDSGVTLTVFKSRAVDGSGDALMPGSLLNWDYAPHSLDLVCRVIERRMRMGKASDQLKIIRERGAFPRPYVPATDDRVLPTEMPPGEITSSDVRLWLLPSGLASDRQLAALVQRQNVWDSGSLLYLSTDGSSPWTQILDQRFPAAKCAVVSTITSGASTVRVSTSSIDFGGFEAQDANGQTDDTLCLLIDDELVSVGTITVVSAGVYDIGILRGRRGTTAASHSASAACWLFERAKLVSVSHLEFYNVTSGGAYSSTVATKYFKIALYTASETGDPKPDDPGLSYQFPDVSPSAPASLTATAYPGFIRLTWAAVDGAAEYQVFRNTVNTFGSATLIAETASPNYSDPTVTPGTLYYFWIVAVNLEENSSTASAVASATASSAPLTGAIPSVPTAPSKTAQGTYQTSDGNTLAFFTITVAAMPANAVWQNLLYRRNGATQWLVAAQIANTGSVSVRLDDLSPGIGYEIAVQAWSGAGGSTIVAATSSNLTSVTGSGTTATKTAHGLAESQALVFVSGTGFSGLTAGSTYYVHVLTSSTFSLATAPGGSALTLGTSSAGIFTPITLLVAPSDTTAPAAPTGLAATAYAGYISLAWTPPADLDVAEYQLWRNTTNTFATATNIAETASQNFKDPAVTPGTAYYYWITAVDFSENISSASTVASVTAAAAPVTDVTPAAPTALTVASTGTYYDGSFSAHALAIVNVAALPANAIFQNVLYRRVGAAEWAIAAQLTNNSSATARIDDLVCGKLYEIAVQAWSASKASAIVITVNANLTGVTATASTDTVTKTAHGLGENQEVLFASGTGFGGLTAGTTYFTHVVDANNFQLYTKPFWSGSTSLVDITSNGSSGTFTPYSFINAPILAPLPPTGGSLIAGNDSGERPPPKLIGGAQAYVVTVTWVESLSSDVQFYELVGTAVDSDASADFSAGGGDSITIAVGPKKAYRYTTTPSSNRYIRVRAWAPAAGGSNVSSWLRIGDANALYAFPTSDLFGQDSSNINLTGGKAILGGFEANQTTAVDVKGVNIRLFDSGLTQRARFDNTTGNLYNNNNQVVGPRITGWGAAPTDGARAALTSASTQTAHNSALRQLIADLHQTAGHGMIGT